MDELLAGDGQVLTGFLESPVLEQLAPQSQASAASTVLPAGTKLGPYVVQSILGVGGMGEVYKARDTRLNRTVATKVLPQNALRSGQAVSTLKRGTNDFSARSITQNTPQGRRNVVAALPDYKAGRQQS